MSYSKARGVTFLERKSWEKKLGICCDSGKAALLGLGPLGCKGLLSRYGPFYSSIFVKLIY